MADAYLILAHRFPQQLLRLLDRLEDGRRVLHWNAGSPEQDLVRREARSRGVVLVPPRRVCWGHWSGVEATLDGLRLALGHGDVERVVLLSGQDYPLVPAHRRQALLAELHDRSAFTAAPVPDPGVAPDGGVGRTQWVHLPRRGRSRGFVRLPIRLGVPRSVRLHIGHQWIVLSRDAAAWFVNLGSRHPLHRTFRFAQFPEESFFQTGLLSSPFADRRVAEDIHYIDWSVEPGPKILGLEDMPAMLASGKLFARKFDAEADAAVLDLLDEEFSRSL